MKSKKCRFNLLLCSFVLATCIPFYPASAQAASDSASGQAVPAADGGWASTAGGAFADAKHMFTVTNRQELLEALGARNGANSSDNDAPKIIYVKGTARR
ncbi:hypothetical protein O9H85_12415 [Paenibacillus filicis]|uniref:Pectate lyase n=1 Tax=Paenibacillus gyeongsangnamensis TaxID=3388067 RepID=A0ABT4Q8M2_9BACL|nr:hypothetical protein [Paenibacillus filicis]MCZ8513215.1 hypothetical protein [Paenibacillus filicis]